MRVIVLTSYFILCGRRHTISTNIWSSVDAVISKTNPPAVVPEDILASLRILFYIKGLALSNLSAYHSALTTLALNFKWMLPDNLL